MVKPLVSWRAAMHSQLFVSTGTCAVDVCLADGGIVLTEKYAK